MSTRRDLQARQDRLVLDALPDTLPHETREIATASGLNMGMTRRVLLRLETAGKVARLDGTGAGLPWGWKRVVSRLG